MNETVASFEPDLRISHKWVLAILLISGIPIFLVSEILSDPSPRLRLMPFTLVGYILLGIVWLLDNWQETVGRWATIILLIALIYFGYRWWDTPEFFTLMVIPTALAAALISLPAATAVAGGITILLFCTSQNINVATTVTVLVSVWTMVVVMYAVYHPIHQLSRWSWEYFQQARAALAEAQDRKLELEQALKDLAQANLQLTRLNLLAQGLRQVAEDARRAKEEFVANVSHELRTPLNMITGFSEMIVQAPQTYGSNLPPALLADLTVIYRNAAHLADLVDDVLDLSQIEAGQMAVTKEQVQFHEIVEPAVTAVRPLYDSKGLYLETGVPRDLPLVFCDPTRIREVLLNLLSNAGRFTEQGGVQLRVWQDHNDIVVSVADSGPGIASDELEKVFQPFHQVDGSIRRRYDGTGLGLSITERFIKLHEGKIWIESEQGVGTTFFFRLPIAPPMPLGDGFLRGYIPDWEYVHRTRTYKAPKSVIRPRFVVLEEGNLLQRLLTRYWNETEIVPVSAFEEAVTELANVPTQALIINEISMHKSMDYLNTANTLPNNTPVITCSMSGEDELCDTPGISVRLVKPVTQQMLLEALDQLKIEAGTVLIVDDEPDALQLFGRMLDSSGRNYQALLARDGKEALNILQERRPEVMLLDLVMPELDGFQLLEIRSQNPAMLEIPVVIISARDPVGQPIVSRGLAITRSGGLSVRQLLSGVEALSKVFATTGPVGDPRPTEALPG